MEEVNLALCQLTALITVGMVVLTMLEPLFYFRHVEKDAARVFVEQAKRWYAAAQQSSNATFTFQHCNYALAYLNAARYLVDDQTIERVTSLHVHRFSRAVEENQRKALRGLTRVAQVKGKPRVAPPRAATASWID